MLVGINLLREGLDLPEVSLVSILDADKEGFLRSETSLIQMIGRAARNVDGQVVMYADKVTASMQKAIDITQQRRLRQISYNLENGINPQTIRKAVGDILSLLRPDDTSPVPGKDRRRQRERDKVQRELKTLPTAGAQPVDHDAGRRDARGRGRAEVRVRSPSPRRSQRADDANYATPADGSVTKPRQAEPTERWSSSRVARARRTGSPGPSGSRGAASGRTASASRHPRRSLRVRHPPPSRSWP